MTWTCLSVTNGGNQPIITLQSFKNVLPKPSFFFSLCTHRLYHCLSRLHPLPSSSKSPNKLSTLHWSGCPPAITIKDSPNTCAFGFSCIQMRLWGKKKKKKLHQVLVFLKGPTFLFCFFIWFFSFFFKKPILPPVGLLYGKGTHSTIQSLLHFDCVASSPERTALSSEQLPVVGS